MGVELVLSLLGGLALFMYGMQMMSNGLESVAGNKMKDILEKLTSNRFLGIIVGALITAVIQSSSATTVMVVGFVNSGMMTLNQAVWIIMGANIGTTITGQLIALDVGALAPLIAFIGVAIVVFSKNEKVQFVGEIIAGLGILFVGMNMMGDSMIPLREYPPFINLMTRFSNPLIGIIAGMIFTAVIQSSSASVGILQALALSGVISFHDAAFVLFGQNIGTCITAILASIGTERSAKRATIIHLSFNIIGTAIFTILCLVTPLTNYVAGFSGSSITKQIANMHTLFNISTTILLIPFGNYLAKLATKILPEKAEEKEHHKHLKYIKSVDTRVDATFGTSAINLQNLRNEIQRMLEMARVNVEESFDAFLAGSSKFLGDVDKREDYIDYLNKEISRAAAKMMANETNVKASKNIGSYLDMTSNIERIGDHAVNICDYTKLIEEKHIVFSDDAKQQMEEMKMICEKMFHNISKVPEDTQEWLQKVHDSENFIDQKTEEFYESHLERINRGECNDEACIIFSEMLTDFERIGDHASYIAHMSNEMHDNHTNFSQEAWDELNVVMEAVREDINITCNAFMKDDKEMAQRVAPLGAVITGLCDVLKMRHAERLSQGKCGLEEGTVFSDILNSFCRIATHCASAMVALMKSGETGSDLHIHDSKIYPTNRADYYQYFKEYGQKYDIGNQEGHMLSMEPEEVE